jgi:hypothetical protein
MKFKILGSTFFVLMLIVYLSCGYTGNASLPERSKVVCSVTGQIVQYL